MKTIWIIVASLLHGVPGALAAPSWTGKVVAVADGDTLTVLRDGAAVKVRLHGVDAPETAQTFGDRAKQLTSKLVFGKEVRVEAVTTDKYGRTVALVFLDGARTLNEELLKAGLAWWFRKYSPADKKLQTLEAAARAARRGLWADASSRPPWEFRHPELACQKDADCVFLPAVCPRCPPCKPTPRPVGNAAEAARIHHKAARVRCAPPSCGACASEKNWMAGKPVCVDGQCTFLAAAAPPASGLYHGNTRSKVLHAPGCGDYDCKSCNAGFKTLEDGKKAGYRAHAACVDPFERCHGACLKRNMARAVGWEMVEAECRRECSPGR